MRSLSEDTDTVWYWNKCFVCLQRRRETPETQMLNKIKTDEKQTELWEFIFTAGSRENQSVKTGRVPAQRSTQQYILF